MNVPHELKEQLSQFGQLGVLRFWDELDSESQTRLVDQLADIDLDLIGRLSKKRDVGVDWEEIASRAEPPRAYRLGNEEPSGNDQAAIDAGEQLLREGKVGMILVAGGQGSRLGFPKPKGMFEIGPVSNRTLFQVIADQLRARSKKYGHHIPLFVMTSRATHDETIAYLENEDYLGLTKDGIQVFCQGVMPAVDAETSEMLLEGKDTLALSPDGHGGMLAAFAKSGCLDRCENQGIEHLFYAQIDNPLANVCDPRLLGYHAIANSDMTTQVVKKQHALERVGNVVQLDGKVQIIEYSDLPESVAKKVDENGEPLLWAGNIAVHVFRLEFLCSARDQEDTLPFHIAHKKVTCLDAEGERIEPADPNAYKFERFIFDLLPFAKNAIAVEADKAESFAPVKNADGASADTPRAARDAIVALHRSWLHDAGIEAPESIDVEIDPLFAIDVNELASRKSEIPNIEAPVFITDRSN